MAFVVRAISGKSGEGTFIVDRATRKDAFETAGGLLGQGKLGVTIMGDDSRVYTTSEFAEALAEGSDAAQRRAAWTPTRHAPGRKGEQPVRNKAMPHDVSG